ncbi:YfjI family protein [Deinococcus yavapaiensis]|uniref:Uncharacterized protein DUF3987 n=1 Tax=Deinococcus yavapaiensis KR-236 TaxID=694435 RepID=A0A318S4X3_9DEIO|nr:DUF3987 domain-containing protein [Deinococcus yavapaiensis]PYE48364.1 uncharacterized protein DUF3987 [Deinococcus yavapaiensis KR-236]
MPSALTAPAELFAAYFLPNPLKHGRFKGWKGTKKIVETLEGQPVTVAMLEKHLGVGKFLPSALGYLPGTFDGTLSGAVDMDAKDYPSVEALAAAKERLLAECAALNVEVYPERSSSGRGCHVWLFTDDLVTYRDMRAALRFFVNRAALPASTEVFPKGDDAASNWLIMPYHGALWQNGGRLGATYLETTDGEAIPVDELDEWITRNPASVVRNLAALEGQRTTAGTSSGSSGEGALALVNALARAALQKAPSARHDAAAAFLNVAHRAEQLEAMLTALGGEDVHAVWCADGSRDLDEWRDEIARWAEHIEEGKSDRQRGFPYLKEQGFDLSAVPLPSTAKTAESPEEPWGERQSLPPVRPSAPTMPPDMVPASIRAWLLDLAELTCVPLECVAASAIAAFSGLLGRTVVLKPERFTSWRVVPNLWYAVVAPPGSMKTFLYGEPTRFLKVLEERARQAFEDAKLEAEVEAEALKFEEAQLKKGKSFSREKLLDLKRRAQTLDVTCKRYYVNDATPEKLGELLNENPRGFVVLKDELAAFIDQLKREDQATARGFYLSAWDGNEGYTFDRIQRGTIRIPATCLSIIGAIQEGPLQKFVNDSRSGSAGDQGMLQRFQLLVWPDNLGEWKRPTRRGNEAAFDAVLRVAEVIDRWYPPSEDGPHVLTFDEEARGLFEAWRDTLEVRTRGGDEELRRAGSFASHLGKYRSLVPSLALVFHALEHAERNARLDDVPPVSADALELALNWAEFLEVHARKVYAAELGLSFAGVRALAEKIKAGAVKDGMDTYTLRRKDWQLLQGSLFDEALDGLVSLGWARRVEVETGGRPREVFRLHPDLREGGEA